MAYFHGVSGSVSLVNGTIFKYESELTCCNLKFCFSQCSKPWFFKNQLFFESRARWPASRQENGVFEVWPVGLIFFIFTNWDCTCFYEKKIIVRVTRANHKTAASLNLLFAQKHELHLTQLILSYFCEKYGKNAQFVS